MKQLLFAIALLLPATAYAEDDLADWCSKVTKASSIVICSDGDLRQQVSDRNKLFDLFRSKLSPDEMKALIEEQNRWVKVYTARCGIGLDDSVPVYIPPSVVECYRRESGARSEMLRARLNADDALAKEREEAAEAARERVRQAAREQAAREAAEAERQKMEGERQERVKKQEEERERERAREKLEREAQEKRDEEVRKYAEAKGYKLITFEDFELDGKELAKSGGKIALRGYYMSIKGSEAFLPNLRRGSSDDMVHIETGDAERDARKLLLECRKSERSACPMMIMAKVVVCTRKSDEKPVPCLIVQDARDYGKPEN